MNNCIVQEGIVTGITPSSVTVSVTPPTACGSCQASSVCFGSSGGTREMVIPRPEGHFSTGETVRISMAPSMGRKAVFYGYLYPLVLLLVTLFLTYALIGNEALSALLSLLVLIPYYLILYINRNRMATEFRFSIEALPK